MVKKKYILTGEDCNIWHLIQFQHRITYRIHVEVYWIWGTHIRTADFEHDCTDISWFISVTFLYVLKRYEFLSLTSYTVISNMVVCLNTTPPSLQYINLISKYLLVWPFSHERTSRVRYSMLSFVKSLNIHSNRVYMKCWNFLWDNGQLSKYQIKR